jgi:DNA-binding transcriptional LysR family regulator
VAFNIPPHQDVAIECSIRDPVCVIVHPGHPLAKRRSLRLQDLAAQRIAMLGSTFKTRTLVDTALATEGISLSATVTINHIGHAINFAQTKMGVTFAPRHIVQRQVEEGLLRAIPLQHSILANSRTAVCRHRSRKLTRPAQAFLDVLHRHFLEIGARHRRL